jgi:hypothetical protein
VPPHGKPRRRQIQTWCGTLTLERPWYHCAGCGQGWSTVEIGLLGASVKAEAMALQIGLDRRVAPPVDHPLGIARMAFHTLSSTARGYLATVEGGH